MVVLFFAPEDWEREKSVSRGGGGREREETDRLLILPNPGISYSFSSMKFANILIINLPFLLMLG